MSDAGKSPAMLLDDLASLDPQERREVAATLRRLSATFAEVPDCCPALKMAMTPSLSMKTKMVALVTTLTG